jgi:5,10-methylenetetrahydromethanopterin reductase
MRFSLQLIPEQPLDELAEAVAVADRLGFYGVYGADEIYHWDFWTVLAACARATDQIRLGPCVSPIYLRDPTHIAQLAATLDALSNGRAEVVIGIGNLAMLEQYGVTWRGTRPIRRLREAHMVMRALLDTGEVDFHGDCLAYSGVTTAARPVQGHVPILIGAMGGPQSMELAGAIADGMFTACAYSPQAVAYAVGRVAAGAERAGRARSTLDVGDNVLGAIGADGDAARAAARVLAAFYLPSMPPALLERHGIDRAELQPVMDAFAAGQVERALALTPDDVADRLTVAGTPDEWVSQLQRDVLPAGIDHLLFTFADPYLVRAWSGRAAPGVPDLCAQIQLLHDEVLPALA